MRDWIEKARKRARQMIEEQYEDICTVIEYKNYKDEDKKIMREGEVVIIKEQPCKLSFKSSPIVEQTEKGGKTVQIVKLFLSPDIAIKPNSKIEVTDKKGKIMKYAHSGVSSTYDTHQEIELKMFKGWS